MKKYLLLLLVCCAISRGYAQKELRLFEGQKPVSFNQLQVTAEYSYFQDTAGLGLGVFHSMAGTMGYSVDYGMALSSMPFTGSVRENNGINTLNYTPFQNFYKFNFNHAQYLENIRSQLLQKLSPEALMNSALRRVATIRQNYEQQLRGEVSHLQQEYTKQYHLPMQVPAGATNLGASDMTALRTQLLPAGDIQQYQRDLAKLNDMAQHKDAASLSKDTSYLHTVASAKHYETMEKIFTHVVSWRQKFENNPIVKQLLKQSTFSPGAMRAYLANPANLSQVLDDQGGLSTLQRFFVNVNKLDMGQNAVQSGELNMSNVVNTGVNTEFQNKTTTMGVIYGQNRNTNNWQQAGLTSQVTNEYANVTGFKLGTGTGSPVDQSVSFDFFKMNNGMSLPGQPTSSTYLPVAPHNDGVITLHTGFAFGGVHNITLDLSRSFGSYQQGGADSSGGKLPTGSVLSGAGKANYAAIVSYTGVIWKTDVKLALRKVGLGYENPGNALLHSGETQVSYGLARKLNKLTLKYDGHYRRQVFDPYGNYVYSDLANKWQAGYKITRNDRVNLTYQRSDYRSAFYGQAPVRGFTSRLQLDGSYRFVLDGKKVTNNITISRQEMSIPLTTGGNYSNNSVLITQTSTIMAGKNPLSLTIMDNRADNTSYYFNTSLFSSEANYSYAPAGWPRMSSGIGYYDNTGWNKQVGIRHQVSAVVNQKVNVDFQLSYKKAVQVIQKALADQLFVNAMVHYTFK